MADVVLIQPIAVSAVAMLRRAGLSVHVASDLDLDSLRPHLAEARAVITRNHGFDASALTAAPHLVVIGVHGTGTERIARTGAERRGIVIVNTPGTNARAVAELALALMLACARDIPEADRAVRLADTGYRDRSKGMELGGRVLGLVGMGHVARALVPMAHGLGLVVHAISRHSPPADLVAAGVHPCADLDSLCQIADVISLHAIPTDRPLFDARQLARMRRGTILVNTARGVLIDEAALASALKSGHLRAAGLDVTTVEPITPGSPLFETPGLVLTPHIGGTTEESMERTGQEVACLVLAALGLAVQ